MKVLLPHVRFNFMNWLIIPVIGIWMAISYLAGIMHQPEWQKNDIMNDPAVLSARTRKAYAAQKPAKLQWDGSALLTLWFDDAWSTQFTTAYPKMDDMGFSGSIAVPTQSMGVDGYMSWAQLERLAYARWEVNSHTRTHTCNIKNIKPEDINSEIIGSKQDLEAYGYSPSIFVTPCGVDSPLWKDTVKQHYLAFRGSEEGVNSLPLTNAYNIKSRSLHATTTDQDVMQWIQEAQANHGWLILVFHQIDNSKEEFSTNPDMFSKILQRVKDSRIQVVLPEQVLQLVVTTK